MRRRKRKVFAGKTRVAVMSVLLGAIAWSCGCQEAIRSTFSSSRSTGGVLLEASAPARVEDLDKAGPVDDVSEMNVDASAQRWSRPKAGQAPREIVVSVIFLAQDGRPLQRRGSFDFRLCRRDEEAPLRVGKRLAAFYPTEPQSEAAWDATQLNRRYLFRLALREGSKEIAGELFAEDWLFVVVDVLFRSDDGGALRSVSAPVLLVNTD